MDFLSATIHLNSLFKLISTFSFIERMSLPKIQRYFERVFVTVLHSLSAPVVIVLVNRCTVM